MATGKREADELCMARGDGKQPWTALMSRQWAARRSRTLSHSKGCVSLSAVPISGGGEVWGLSHILQTEREERGPRKDQGGSTCS